jgi:hypothetical protein
VQAKTIDLCNNPKTKEPKLVAARRIIKEWPDLDEEQANFTASVDAMFAAEEAAFAESGDAATSAGNGDANSSDAADAQQQPADNAGAADTSWGLHEGSQAAEGAHDEL